MSSLVARDLIIPQSFAKGPVSFDLTELLNLQSQFRNFKLHLQQHPLEGKVNSISLSKKPTFATRSLYNLSNINNWTEEDEDAKNKREKSGAIKKMIDPFSIYDPTTFPIHVSIAEKDSDANRKIMLAELEKLLKCELESLVNGAIKGFTDKFLTCHTCKRTHSKCMTPTITMIFVDLHLEMRRADPMRVTKGMVDGWLKTLENVSSSYQRELVESGGACDKIVAVKRKVEKTWVRIVADFLPTPE
jgi:hypothetical protein